MSVTTSAVITDTEPIATKIAAIVFDPRFLLRRRLRSQRAFLHRFFSVRLAVFGGCLPEQIPPGLTLFSYALCVLRCHLCVTVAVPLEDDLGVQFAPLHSRQEGHPGEDLRQREGQAEAVGEIVIATRSAF